MTSNRELPPVVVSDSARFRAQPGAHLVHGWRAFDRFSYEHYSAECPECKNVVERVTLERMRTVGHCADCSPGVRKENHLLPQWWFDAGTRAMADDQEFLRYSPELSRTSTAVPLSQLLHARMPALHHDLQSTARAAQRESARLLSADFQAPRNCHLSVRIPVPAPE